MNKLQKKGRFSEEEVMDILQQICEAFLEMKKFNVIHRDLKPANILVHKDKVKIADLGFAKTVQNFQSAINTSTVGSPIYMSPQVLMRQNYSSKCDIWSLGIILYQLLYGKVPWIAMDIQLLAKMIMSKPLNFKKEIPVSNEMKDLIYRCLRFHEHERLSWDDLFNHPVIQKCRFKSQGKVDTTGGQAIGTNVQVPQPQAQPQQQPQQQQIQAQPQQLYPQLYGQSPLGNITNQAPAGIIGNNRVWTADNKGMPQFGAVGSGEKRKAAEFPTNANLGFPLAHQFNKNQFDQQKFMSAGNFYQNIQGIPQINPSVGFARSPFQGGAVWSGGAANGPDFMSARARPFGQ
eukprot:TRINITY_DN9212_c0_g5_i2.p1 TRINITY_DN9212_c0_g5~~TRINITY_DN9212_c0_g5_i2.p1  ORF type:complete len:347 (-),score=110.78 TRINITY_DN9212_c0_g5_i2:109-1149(-)